jgi:predicted MFS family arabinose efflux permease
VLLGLGALVFGLIAAPISGWRDPIVLAALTAGLIALIVFVRVEYESSSAMLPLDLFRSRTFSAVNFLTVLLYAALGGVMFFVPFALIQVGGYPATFAGAAFLPFTVLMAALSRWSGGLLDRFGPRLPLVIGPAIGALGIAVMALMVERGSYWQFVGAIVILGFGMVVTVAPLTTTVINAVPERQVGVASGINNAVSSVANLLAVAILGGIAVASLNHALDRDLQTATLSETTRHTIDSVRGQLVIDPALAKIQGGDRPLAQLILKGALAESIRSVLLVAALLALSAAAAGTLLPGRSASGTKVSPA